MPALAQEWLNLLIRWVHVIAAIMWIGDSFLFMWLDSHLVPPGKVRDGNEAVHGELWMTHSGGFYEVIKRKSLRKGEAVGPLYWFKWESYTTWISGFLLLGVVYYLGGAAFLIDSSVRALEPWQAIALSLGSLPIAFIVYDTLWRTPLAKNQIVFGLICFALLVAAGYGFTHVFSGRGAFLQMGAMIGTVMAANVFFRIIPSQRHMLAATEAGTPVDTSYGVRAKGRSIHNHYATLPVLFTMLSNHFPSTYGSSLSWVVLALLFIFGAGLKYLMNFRGKSHPLVFCATVFALIGTIVVTNAPWEASKLDFTAYASKPKVSFATANAIVQARCISCHGVHPTNKLFAAPPVGMVFETPEQVKVHAERMFIRSVATKTMPMGNMTGMTQDERDLLGAWVAQGSDVNAPGPVELPNAPTTQVAKSPADEAKERFAITCVACHGENGDGKGPSAGALQTKPRNYTDPEWQKSVTDADIKKIILEGGESVGKSSIMPANEDLVDKPEVVDELVKIVRGFAKK